MLHVRGYSRRLTDQLELGIASAWHGAGFARQERLPDLDKVMRKSERGRPAVDRAFTANETRRWAKVLAEQERRPS